MYLLVEDKFQREDVLYTRRRTSIFLHIAHIYGTTFAPGKHLSKHIPSNSSDLYMVKDTPYKEKQKVQ